MHQKSFYIPTAILCQGNVFQLPLKMRIYAFLTEVHHSPRSELCGLTLFRMLGIIMLR